VYVHDSQVNDFHVFHVTAINDFCYRVSFSASADFVSSSAKWSSNARGSLCDWLWRPPPKWPRLCRVGR